MSLITIPEKLYVGLQKREKDTPLGFVTPDTGDAAFRKRKETVDSWATGYAWEKKKTLTALTDVKNELIDGYIIADDIRRYGWSGGNVVWRMVDPRGFEFEISSANMASIIDCSTIKNGTIEGKCIFGRQGAQNVLLPENSQPYKDATVNTSRAKKKISMKDVKIGDKLLLKDGSEVIFAGSRKILFHTVKRSDPTTDTIRTGYTHDLLDLRQRYVVVKTAGDKDTWLRNASTHMPTGKQYLSSLGDLHVSQILERDVAIDPKLFKGIPETPTSAYGSTAYAMYDVSAKVSDFTVSKKELTFDQMLSYMKKSGSSSSLNGIELFWSSGDTSFSVTRWYNEIGNNRLTGQPNIDLHQVYNPKWSEGKYTVDVSYGTKFAYREPTDALLKTGVLFTIEVKHKDGTIVRA